MCNLGKMPGALAIKNILEESPGRKMIQGRPELSNFSSGKVLVTERFEPLRAGGFRASHAQRFAAGSRQGPEALDPAKNAGAFFRNKKIAKQLIGSGADRPPEAESPIRVSAQQRGSSL